MRRLVIERAGLKCCEGKLDRQSEENALALVGSRVSYSKQLLVVSSLRMTDEAEAEAMRNAVRIKDCCILCDGFVGKHKG